QRECEHGHDGEAAVFQQLAEGEFEIVHGFRSMDQIPNPKHQAPENSQAPNSNDRRPASVLGFEFWSFFGVWMLELAPVAAKRPRRRLPSLRGWRPFFRTQRCFRACRSSWAGTNRSAARRLSGTH